MMIPRIVLTLFAGILLGIGFVFGALWWSAFFGAALLMYTVVRARSLKEAAFLGWTAGVVWYGIALAPVFWSTLPLTWFGIESPFVQSLAAGGSWLFMTVVLAVGTLFFSVAARFLATGSWKDVAIFPLLWVFSEWLGAFVFSIVTLGPGSLLGGHFTYGAIGYVLANDPVLLQGAWLGGIYALSLFVGVVGTMIHRSSVSSGRTRYMWIVSLSVLFMLWLSAHLMVFEEQLPQEENNTLSIAVISRYMPPQIWITPEQEEGYFKEMYDLVAPLREIDVVVFPENTAFVRTLWDGRHERESEALRSIGNEGVAPVIIDSEDRGEGGVIHSRITYATSSTSFSYGYKQLLMPLGEYIPYVYRVLLRIAGGKELLDAITLVRGYERGPEGGGIIVKGVRIASRLCAEVMSPSLYAAHVREGTGVLVNLSSHSWFRGSRIVYENMQRIAQVRAVESGRWFIQSGNMVPAFVLNERGKVIGETAWGVPSSLIASVPERTNTTPYIAVGNWIIPLLFIGTVGMIERAIHKRRRKGEDIRH